MKIANTLSPIGRPTALRSCGAARRAFDMTVARMPKRTSIALTNSMAHHPEVQHEVAEMRMALDAAA